jgi:hypothetical protein
MRNFRDRFRKEDRHLTEKLRRLYPDEPPPRFEARLEMLMKIKTQVEQITEEIRTR